MTKDSEQRLLLDLGFPEPYKVTGRYSIADLYKPNERCGIYVLHFANGEYYAGQAKDVTRRFSQHRNTHKDITHISFQLIAPDELDPVERGIIGTLEQNGFLLRNITFTSIPKGESDFDLIMPQEQQDSWLQDLDFIDDVGQRFESDSLRRKYRNAYQKLFKKPHSQLILDVMQTYVRLGLPAIFRGEVSFWSVSCLPQTNVYARININWQEVFTAVIFEGEPWISLHFAASPFDHFTDEDFDLYEARYSTAEWSDHYYHPGGQDQVSVAIPVEDAAAFISDSQILAAIRLFNLRLMRKGPCNFGRYHCLELADRLLP